MSVVIQLKLSMNFLFRDIGKLIQHSSDGWNPPLKIPNAREVNVHRDGEILSGVGPPSAKLSCVSNSNATAVESEGEGWPYFCFKSDNLYYLSTVVYHLQLKFHCSPQHV